MSTATEAAKAELDRLIFENRDCRCGGHGMLIVYHSRWSGSRIGTRRERNAAGEWVEATFPAEVAAHCACRVGTWIRDRTDPELQRRIPWVEDILKGRSRWLLKPPRQNVGEPGGDLELPPIPTRSDINAMFPKIPKGAAS